MPSSQYLHVSDVLQLVHHNRPKSILDVGCGYGRWGMLFREILDVLHERYDQDKWITQIDGVEVFTDYIKPYHHYFYDHIFVTDIRDHIVKMENYDLIIAGDVIEHFPMDVGQGIIQSLKKKTSMLIVAVPLGNWPQGEVLGNVYETHQSTWTHHHIKELDPDLIKYYKISQPDDYAVFAWGLSPTESWNCHGKGPITQFVSKALSRLRRLASVSSSRGNQ